MINRTLFTQTLFLIAIVMKSGVVYLLAGAIYWLRIVDFCSKVLLIACDVESPDDTC